MMHSKVKKVRQFNKSINRKKKKQPSKQTIDGLNFNVHLYKS